MGRRSFVRAASGLDVRAQQLLDANLECSANLDQRDRSYLLAQDALESNDFSTAAKLLSAAQVPGRLLDKETFELAEAYRRSGQLGKAASLFGSINDLALRSIGLARIAEHSFEFTAALE